VAAIQAQQFPRRGADTGRCPQCDFQSICPGFREFTAGDLQPATPSAMSNREVDAVIVEQGIETEAEPPHEGTEIG
jgi:hypothetical protein